MTLVLPRPEITRLAGQISEAPTKERQSQLFSCDLEIVIPVYNEEGALERTVRRLDSFLASDFPFTAMVTIVDNASTDNTWQIACLLSGELTRVHAQRLDEKGRGRALRAAWIASSARVVAYMDVDLSTDLSALLPLVAPLMSGHSELAIGTRLSASSRVTRGPKREVISRSYNALLHATMRTSFSDAQCGFKAVRTDCARALLPLVRDTGWFFDTELLILAQRSGMRISEVPVDWIDDPDSRVDIVSTAREDLRGMLRVSRAMARGELPLSDLREAFGRGGSRVPSVPPSLLCQLSRFASVGIVSTVAYLLVFLGLRGGLGAQSANLAALGIIAVGNTAVNRRFTFDIRGSGMVRDQIQGLLVFTVGFVCTAGSLALLQKTDPFATRPVEIAVLVAANLIATGLRFILFKRWVFKKRSEHPAKQPVSA